MKNVLNLRACDFFSSFYRSRYQKDEFSGFFYKSWGFFYLPLRYSRPKSAFKENFGIFFLTPPKLQATKIRKKWNVIWNPAKCTKEKGLAKHQSFTSMLCPALGLYGWFHIYFSITISDYATLILSHLLSSFSFPGFFTHILMAHAWRPYRKNKRSPCIRIASGHELL